VVTTINIPEQTVQRLRALAAVESVARGKPASVSAIVRKAVELYLSTDVNLSKGATRCGRDPVPHEQRTGPESPTEGGNGSVPVAAIWDVLTSPFPAQLPH
jgi:hypothetical protein